jgi:hypothetical protein
MRLSAGQLIGALRVLNTAANGLPASAIPDARRAALEGAGFVKDSAQDDKIKSITE